MSCLVCFLSVARRSVCLVVFALSLPWRIAVVGTAIARVHPQSRMVTAIATEISAPRITVGNNSPQSRTGGLLWIRGRGSTSAPKRVQQQTT